MPKKKTNSNGLSAEAQRLHDRVAREWNVVDAAGEMILMTACQALDRLRQAQALISEEGIITHDRFGQAKLNPACQIEKEARAGLLIALKAMNLDLESLEDGDDAT
jgi:P27 family predicted phage terminase small subunit